VSAVRDDVYLDVYNCFLLWKWIYIPTDTGALLSCLLETRQEDMVIRDHLKW